MNFKLHRTRRRRAVIVTLVLAAFFQAAVPPSIADSISVESEGLPSARRGASAVWDGERAYIFGGSNFIGIGNVPNNEIVIFDPATGDVQLANARLPSARAWTTAAWDGRYAYITGGSVVGPNPGTEIVRYDPENDTVKIMQAKLPRWRVGPSSVWAGDFMYIFGGWNQQNQTILPVLRYDPVEDKIKAMNSTLPRGLNTAAIWDGTRAYVFGGEGSEAIYRYDPANDTATLMNSRTADAMEGPSAVWDGRFAYVFGGRNGLQDSDLVFRFDPTTDSIQIMSARLPTGRMMTSAIWDGTNAYIFGGSIIIDGPATAEILRYELSPGPPQAVAAHSSPSGDVEVTWDPPPQNSKSRPIQNYSIERSTDGGAFQVIAQVGNVFTYTDPGRPFGSLLAYRVAAVNADGEGAPSSPVVTVGGVGP